MKKLLLFLSMLAVFAASAADYGAWTRVKTQADVANEKNTALAQKILALRTNPKFPFTSYSEAVAAAVETGAGYTALFFMDELKGYIPGYFADSSIHFGEKIRRIKIGNIQPDVAKSYCKDNIVKLFKCSHRSYDKTKAEVLDFYIKEILPEEREEDAKKTLKTLNKIVYPQIENGDENVKRLAVKIKLALETLD